MGKSFWHIVGVNKADKSITLLNSRIVEDELGSKVEPIGMSTLSEGAVVSALKRGVNIVNATLSESGRLVGRDASLLRFTPNNFYGILPWVVIAEVRSTDGDRLLGYTLANNKGKVSTVRYNDVLAQCCKVYASSVKYNSNAVFLQNYIFVNGDNGEAPFIKSYNKDTAITVYRKQSKQIKNVEAAKPSAGNHSSLDKLKQYFNEDQIKEIMTGKQHNVQVKIYANPKMSAAQMSVIRKALERRLNPTAYAAPEFSVEAMKAYIVAQAAGVNIRRFVNPKYSAGQISVIGEAWINGVDINDICVPSMSVDDMVLKVANMTSKIYSESYVTTSANIDNIE